MVSLPVLDAAGKEVGQYEIDPQQIAPSINKQLLHDVVVMYEANRRMGTHQARTRGQVSGSTKKMYRQKGTGNARAGSKRTNIRRGGGVARTIKTRDYSYRLPKKAIKLATRMAIASKIMDGEMVVLDQFGLGAPKTKQMAGILKALGLEGKTTLVATVGYDGPVYMSGRNIPGIQVTAIHDVNALDILRPKMMLVSREALDKIKDGTFNQSPAADIPAATTTEAVEA
jgi:large subunit ribosomal protein L4